MRNPSFLMIIKHSLFIQRICANIIQIYQIISCDRFICCDKTACIYSSASKINGTRYNYGPLDIYGAVDEYEDHNNERIGIDQWRPPYPE